MPGLIKELDEKEDVNLKAVRNYKPSYYSGLKRKADEGANGYEDPTEEPPKKKAKLLLDGQNIESTFTEYLQRIFGNYYTSHLASHKFDKETERFLIKCTSCQCKKDKPISVGFYVSKKGSPVYNNTNILRHKCFRNILKPTISRSPIPEPSDEDSGFIDISKHLNIIMRSF